MAKRNRTKPMPPTPPSSPAGASAGAPPVDPAATPLATGLENTPLPSGAGGAPPRDPGFLPGERVDIAAPRVDLAALRLDDVPSTAEAAPVAARRVAEAAGHAVPKTLPQLADEADLLDGEDLTGAEIALLRQFLRNGFPGERVVTPAQARELQGHLGGQSMY